MANDAFENTWTTQSTSNRLDAPLTPGKKNEDPIEAMMDSYSRDSEPYDMNGACIPDSKEAGGNLAHIQDNIQDRFALDQSDVFGKDNSAAKKLY